MYLWRDIVPEKITVIDRHNRSEKRSRHYGSLGTQTYFRLSTKPEFLVAKDEILAALVTVLLAILSLLTMCLTKFHGWSRTITWCRWNVRTSCPIIMWNWPDIFKIWSDSVRWPTVISSPVCDQSVSRTEKEKSTGISFLFKRHFSPKEYSSKLHDL